MKYISTILLLLLFVFLIFIESFFVFSYSKDNTKEYSSKIARTIHISTPSGILLTLEVAKTFEEKQRGLMFRKKLPSNTGMIFVFYHESPRHFWMKNTYIPLSIAFLDAKGKVLNIENMKPLSKDLVSSKGNAQYAIEVKKGMFEKYKIKKGDVIFLPESIITSKYK